MDILTRLAILVVAGMNLAGLRQADGRVAAGAMLMLGVLLLARMAGARMPGAHRRGWRRLLLAHRDALTRRYRQTVRINAYGYEELGKWIAELDRFRRSTGLDIEGTRRDAFDRLATRIVRGWAETAEGAEPAAGIDGMTPQDYEHHCADLLRRAGWSVEVTGGAGDQGADVVATRGRTTLAVQCKLHFASAVGNKAVQEAHAAAGFLEADAAIVVSNASYTRAAQDLGGKLGVLLLHHGDLADLDPAPAVARARV